MILLPWNRQPKGGIAPRIDWSNPITNGLVYADPGQFGRNLVTGQQSSALTGTKVQGSVSGLVRGFGSTFGTGSTDANVTSLTTNATHRTYIARAMRNGAGGGGLGRILDKRTGGAQSELIFWSNGISQLQYGRVYTTTNGQWDFPVGTLPVGTPQVIGISYDSGSTTNDPVFYVNGARQTLTESSAPSGTPVGNSDAYVIGNRTNDNARNWDGWIGEVLIWDRILSPAEVLLVSQNPWQIFAPQIIWIDSPASGGATITAAGSSTATSQASAAAASIAAVAGTSDAPAQAGASASSLATVAGSSQANGQANAVAVSIASAGGASQAVGQAAAVIDGPVTINADGASASTGQASAVAASVAAVAGIAQALSQAQAFANFMAAVLGASQAVGQAAAVAQDAATAADTFTVPSRTRLGATPARDPTARLGATPARAPGVRIGSTTP